MDLIDYKFAKEPITDEVKVYIDPSLKREVKRKTPEEIEQERKEYLKQKKALIGSDRNGKLGMESALGKDERIFKLRAGVDGGTIVTVTSACKELQLARATIIKYAKEANITLFDDEKKVWLNAEEPKDK